MNTPQSFSHEPSDGRVLLDSSQTDNRFTLMEHRLPPYDPGAPLHVHLHHSEACYVLEGTLAVTRDDETITLSAGKAAHVPAGVRHTYWNPTGASTVVLLIYTPAVGFAHVAAPATGPP
jgi:quercetin dioxygenase-like cupin family protein